MIFSGEARYNWLHSIPTRKYDKVEGMIKSRKRRVSLTYRRLRKDPVCACRWPRMCDSQNKQVAVTENMLVGEGEEVKLDPDHQSYEGKPTGIEQKHVYDVYEKIAPHFSKTRYKPWPKVKEFLESLPDGSLNCDVGCGNGKYLSVNDKIMSIGTDRSFNLTEIAHERNKGSQTFICNSLNLSLRSNVFDSVISIAVIHHFSTKDLRIQAMKELRRVAKLGGKILIYVWAFEQERKFTTQDVFVEWHLHDTYEKNNAETQGNETVKKDVKIEQNTGYIETAIKDETKKATIYHRYYHVFK